MKKLLNTIFAISLLLLNTNAQNVEEPEFIGESIIYKTDKTIVPLEKSTVSVKTKAGISLFVVGVGKVKSKISIPGCCSSVRIVKEDSIILIVKAVDNATDPLAVINLFMFESTPKERKAELSSSGTFEGDSQNNLKFVKFKAKKYGKSSYLIKIANPLKGEYGIIVKNPNALNEKTMVASCFGVDEK